MYAPNLSFWLLFGDETPPSPPAPPSVPYILMSGTQQLTGLPNYARTLLLNSNGYGTPSCPGDEYTSTGYHSLALPGCMEKIRRVLFGASPDRLMLNYRARQLMPLLHATELYGYLLVQDPRITYRLDDAPFAGVFGTSITAISGTEPLYLIGAPDPPDASGIAYRQWRVTVTGASEVQIVSVLPPGATVVSSYVNEGGISSIVPVAGGLSIRFAPVSSSSWLLDVKARPQQELAEMAAAIKGLGESVLAPLFGVGTPKAATEPFATFRNLWQSHPELPYSLGGLLLAMIYRTGEIRQLGKFNNA